MAGSNGSVAPADFPPPVDSQGEFIKRELDAEDELIEVGVAIVGGGTAGLACANRLLQLLADDPALLESLGEVPVAVIEKAKTCGGHNLSGAVMRPEPLQRLFPDMSREEWRKEGFAFGEVEKEAVYLTPTKKRSLKIPTPPPFKNHGNEVISVSALGALPAADRRGGGRLHPHRDLGHAAGGGGRRGEGRAHRRQGPRQGRRAEGQLRARHRHQGEGHRAVGGLLGPPHRPGHPRVRPRPRPRAPDLGARREGGLEGPEGRWTA